MPFSMATILTGPDAVDDDGGGTIVTWTSSSPDGTIFQLYMSRVLSYAGPSRVTILPNPGKKVFFQVGTVNPGEENINFASSLPLLSGTGDTAILRWLGGLWEEPFGPGSGMSGFNVYGEATPGGGINYGAILDTVPLGVPGLETTGYGAGGYGMGGYGGGGGGTYFWQSGTLKNGTWHFGVKPFDIAGNLGTAVEATVVIAVPPEPPARNSVGLRMTYTYDPILFKATLNWLASPG